MHNPDLEPGKITYDKEENIIYYKDYRDWFAFLEEYNGPEEEEE